MLQRQVSPVKRGRRFVLRGAVSALAIAGVALVARRGRAASEQAAPGDVTIEAFAADGHSLGSKPVPKIVKTDAEWRKQLTPEEYYVAREAGTERAFTGATWNLHAAGLFRCVCCDNALYNSATKFESGTGWPSFWQPISEKNVALSADKSFFMTRTAVSCSRCAAHLGHVFDDGPKPTGLRYCMNSAAMRFVPLAST